MGYRKAFQKAIESGQSRSKWIKVSFGPEHLGQKVGMLIPLEARVSRTGTLRW